MSANTMFSPRTASQGRSGGSFNPLRRCHDSRMRVLPLRTYDLPDVGDHVIHFTGRTGKKAEIELRIAQLPAQERLVHILVEGVVRGFQTFNAGAPVACFSESTAAAIPKLIRERRYEPCGVAFSKQLVFDQNGGPALYVRGDEWAAVDAALPQPIRSRVVRFWPGAEADPGEDLPALLQRESQWLHEREWRVPTEFRFGWHDVKFLVVPHGGWQAFYASWIESWAGPEYSVVFENIPAVVIDENGNVLRDDTGIWS